MMEAKDKKMMKGFLDGFIKFSKEEEEKAKLDFENTLKKLNWASLIYLAKSIREEIERRKKGA